MPFRLDIAIFSTLTTTSTSQSHARLVNSFRLHINGGKVLKHNGHEHRDFNRLYVFTCQRGPQRQRVAQSNSIVVMTPRENTRENSERESRDYIYYQ